MATYQSDSDGVSDNDDDIQMESPDNSSSESDSLTEEEELSDGEVQNPNLPKRRRRGRPFGSKRPAPSDVSDEDEGIKEKRKSRIHPLHLVLAAMCCSSLCLGGFTEADLASLRENFQALDRTERMQWLLDYFWSHSQFDDESQAWSYMFVLGTKEVCCTAFRETLGIASSTFYAVRKLFINKQKVISRHRIKRKQTRSMQAMAWLHSYADNYGEKLPNTSQIHLPPCSTKQHVYETMVEETQGVFARPISQSHFLRLWRVEASHIAIPKSSRFSKCNICTEIKIRLGETRDSREREVLKEKRDRHLRKQNQERRKYYKHQEKARLYPDRYLSIIIDGMDQSKTAIPHFVHASKFTSAMWKLRTHLVGVIIHGIGIYGFFDLFDYSHSTNLTLSILLSVFYSLRDSMPDVLYLQMDNCARENKNRYLLAFFCHLVEIGLFKKIKISFLMVGHTHEDVDQVFSKFSHWLGRHSALTLEKLMEGFEKCYTPQPHSVRTHRVYNISEWVTPFLNSMRNHSRPHVFKIIKDDEGKAKLLWKRWSTDKTWNDTAEPLLKESVVGRPGEVLPDYTEIEENLDRLTADVRSSYRFFGKEQDKVWWENFFRNYEEEATPDTWILDDILTAMHRRTEPMPVDVGDVFDFALEEESDIPPVIIGRAQSVTQPTNDFMPGDFVCTDVPEYAGEWPQLCKVLQVEQSHLLVQWYKGSRTTSWTPCTRRVKGQKGRTEPWTERVKLEHVWSTPFHLTSAGHIPKKMREKLDEYSF